MKCDKVMLIDNGCVVGYGTHDELMAQCKEYAEISKIQLEA